MALVLRAADGDARIPLSFGPDLKHTNDPWCVSDSFCLNTFANDVTDVGSASTALRQLILVAAELHDTSVGEFRL